MDSSRTSVALGELKRDFDHGILILRAANSFYRANYIEDDAPKKILGISASEAVAEQLFVSTPDEPTLFSTTSAFMQGLYPPLTGSDAAGELLANGTTVTVPFGLNYVQLHGEDAETTDTIWLKGDVACPTYTKASGSFKNSTVFKERTEATKAFYASFKPLLDGVFTEADLTYGKVNPSAIGTTLRADAEVVGCRHTRSSTTSTSIMFTTIPCTMRCPRSSSSNYARWLIRTSGDWCTTSLNRSAPCPRVLGLPKFTRNSMPPSALRRDRNSLC